MGPRDLKQLNRFGDSTDALLRLATMHPSGFVREAAMRSLSSRSGAAAIPFLLIRRNDWVEQVRSVAAEALDHCVSADNAQQIVDALPLIFRLETCVRADHGPFIARIRDLLSQPACADALSAGIGSHDSKVRRACFAIALESSSIAEGELLSVGLSDSDPIVRLMTARNAASSAPGAILELLDRMERDPYTAVRQVGLDARLSLFPTEAASTYERHLLDRSISIRSQCQRALLSAGEAPDAAYRAELGSGRTNRLDVAILGLSETGGTEDAQLASQYLANELPRVRAAAVRAVSRLEPGDRGPMLNAALRDPSPRVSREARSAFVAGQGAADSDELWNTFECAEHRHTRINVISVAQTLPRWERLHFLLRACVNSEAEVQERTVLGVSRWLDTSNRAALSPTPGVVEETRRLLSEAEGYLGQGYASELAFLLKAIC
jgi:HEAT repeat protein